MQIAEVMRKDVKTIRSTDSVKEAARIMKNSDVGSLIVLSGSGEASGIITERDIVTDVVVDEKDPEKTKVEDIMTKNIVVITPEKTLEEAAELMTEKKVKRLPVVYEGNLVGIVTATDLVSYEKKLIEKLSKLFALSQPQKIGG